MATFYANPNEESEPWIENAAIDGYGFRYWHLMLFCFVGFTTILILICCCVRFRIPRTKQEIEADYQRKRLAEKFRERLKLIHNQDMDSIDLQQALKIIQDDFNYENQAIEQRTDRMVYKECGENTTEPMQSFARKIVTIVKVTKSQQ